MLQRVRTALFLLSENKDYFPPFLAREKLQLYYINNLTDPSGTQDVCHMNLV